MLLLRTQSINAYTSHDWPVIQKSHCHLPMQLKGNSKSTSVDALSSLFAQNKDIGTALQRLLLTGDKLSLLRSLNESPQLKYIFFGKA